MQIKKLCLCCDIVLMTYGACAQGTFQNLGFEQAKIVLINNPPALIWETNAYPGWTVLANGVPVNAVQLDSVLFNGAGIDDGQNQLAPLDGKFSALLGGTGIASAQMAIAQSGTIPVGSESLTFLSLGEFSVSFAGHSLPVEVLGNLPFYGTIYGVDISAYAGQFGQLLFQIGPLSSDGINLLDDITFSTQSIPEPGVISMLGLGASLFGLWRSRSTVPSPSGSAIRALINKSTSLPQFVSKPIFEHPFKRRAGTDSNLRFRSLNRA